MKISQSVVKKLVQAVRIHGVSEVLPGGEGEESIEAFYLEDVTVSFQGKTKPALYGVTFEALGREFTILPTLELIVTLPEDAGEESDDTAYELEDPAVVAHLEEYLQWRTVALEKFHI